MPAPTDATMRTTSLSNVRQRLAVGQALPFNVRDADQALLLARGYVLQSAEQLAALCERGALVDLDELQSVRERVMQAPRQALPRLWNDGLQRVNKALLTTDTERFIDALDDASDAVVGLVERDPDLAIFQVLTRDANADTAYGARRSLHAAITSYLVGHRLGWEASRLERVFKVALTMNLSMLELQGVLARQHGELTPEQRAELSTHPLRSVELLLQAGVRDDDWLQAVARHHEQEDGSGYPTGRTDVGELASLVRRADVYTAKLSPRHHRDAMAADLAGRQMFMQDPGHPMTAALVKEFGIYPPGSYVRLGGGETAVVVERGPTVTTPIVACLTNARGMPLAQPVRMAVSSGKVSIAGVVVESQVPFRLSLDKLLSALG